MPELRKDPVVGRWVIISTERSRRPTNFAPVKHERSTGYCPFCPGNEDKTPPEVYAYRPGGGEPNGPGWLVRVVPNKFPALQIEGALDRRGEGLYDKMNGVGAHEVVIETPQHDVDLSDLPVEHIVQVLKAYRERIVDLHRDRRFRYVLIFKNHGAGAGATLEHTHTQLIATPIIPKTLMEEIEGSRRYFELKERCVFCDIIQQETTDLNGRRVVSTNERFLAIEPFAPRVPFETWILPRQHICLYVGSLSGEVVADLAGLLSGLFRTLSGKLGDPPFEMTLYTAPNLAAKILPGEWSTIADDYHWHIEIRTMPDRLNGIGGIHVNETAPEEAAKQFREAWI